MKILALEVWQARICQQHVPVLFSTKSTNSGNSGKKVKIMGFIHACVGTVVVNYIRNMLANSSTCNHIELQIPAMTRHRIK
jgi:hypothetical protein